MLVLLTEFANPPRELSRVSQVPFSSPSFWQGFSLPYNSRGHITCSSMSRAVPRTPQLPPSRPCVLGISSLPPFPPGHSLPAVVAGNVQTAVALTPSPPDLQLEYHGKSACDSYSTDIKAGVCRQHATDGASMQFHIMEASSNM